MKLPLDIASLRQILRKIERFLHTYKAIALFIILASLYGFIVIRIAVLSNAEPSKADVAKAQKTVRTTRIPAKTAEKLTRLEGTNERTQAIFNDARQNPFKE